VETAVPYLKPRLGQRNYLQPDVKIGDWRVSSGKGGALSQLPNPTVAPYASLGEVKLRISALAESQANTADFSPVEQKLKN